MQDVQLTCPPHLRPGDTMEFTLPPDTRPLKVQIPAGVAPGDPGIAIDESALFAGRHHGNLQDSRDYLAWEEELPDQIDEPILAQWHRLLAS